MNVLFIFALLVVRLSAIFVDGSTSQFYYQKFIHFISAK